MHSDSLSLELARFKTPRSRGGGKLEGGLWASPVNPNTNSSAWMEHMKTYWPGWEATGFRFDLHKNASLLELHEPEHVEALPRIALEGNRVNWDRVLHENDAIFIAQNIARIGLFIDWAVSSLVVFNPRVVINQEPIERFVA